MTTNSLFVSGANEACRLVDQFARWNKLQITAEQFGDFNTYSFFVSGKGKSSQFIFTYNIAADTLTSAEIPSIRG